MQNNLMVIMYHYVRDIQRTKYCNLKGLDIVDFQAQLAYLEKNYHFVTAEEVADALSRKIELPPKSVLLTFDDAYSDHLKYVFPLLKKKNIQGSFYIPVKVLKECIVLKVHQIQFILAVCYDFMSLLLEKTKELLKYYALQYDVLSYDEYLIRFVNHNRWDTPEVSFFKVLLQRLLPDEVSDLMTADLFRFFVKEDISSFGRHLYLNAGQITYMKENGMHIGNHGYEHYWLSSRSYAEQEKMIADSTDFLLSLGCDPNTLSFSYPYGDYNVDTLALMKKYNYQFAVTVRSDFACLTNESRFELPRFDTNDIIISGI